MNWGCLSVGLGLVIPTLLLPSQSAANCMLFMQLLDLDKRAMSYLGSEADEERERQLSLIWASVKVDHLLEDLGSEGLAPFLNVRRELAHATRSPQTESARAEILASMHRTRGDLLRYGEAWGCVSRNSERPELMARDLNAVPQLPGRSPAAMSDLTAEPGVGGGIDGYRDRQFGAASLPVDPRDRRVLSLAKDHPGKSAAAIGWLLGLGVCLATAGMVWEERRSRMGERHVCRVPCILRTKSDVARAEVIDISRSGAKIRTNGFPVNEGDTIDVLMQDHRIVMIVAWKNEHFFGGPFKKPISREIVNDVSRGVQVRYGAAARSRS